MCKILAIALILFFAQKGSPEEITKTRDHNAPAVIDIKELLRMESILIDNMEKYVVALQRKLNIINKATEEMGKENAFALLDPEKYLGNPLKSFSLIRRLYSDWKAWRDYLLKPVGEVFIKTMKQVLQKKPTYKDLRNAIEVLYRVQLIYDLQAEDMAKGLLNGKQYDANLTMLDAFSIGKELNKMGFSADSLGWLETAMRLKLDEKLYKRIFSVDAKTIFADYKKIAERNFLPYLPLKVVQSDAFNKSKEFKLNSHNDTSLMNLNLKLSVVFSANENLSTAFKHYSSMCRGNYLKKLSNMFCYNFAIKQEFLPFAAIKLESLKSSPDIMLYHDVLPDSMITTLIDMAEHHLKPANSLLHKSNDDGNTNTAKAANKFYHKEINKIIQRLTLVTGLAEYDYEAATIIKYGIGGHQSLHFDFFESTNVQQTFLNIFSKKCDLKVLNSYQKSSILIYLSDVKEGGATVFPAYNLAITPRKGSALVWKNFRLNGTMNYNTAYSSCPVVVGVKWIMSLRIREQKVQKK